jgi:hypothetical protein
VLDKQFRYAG